MSTNEAKIFLAQKLPSSRWRWLAALAALAIVVTAVWIYASPEAPAVIPPVVIQPVPQRAEKVAVPDIPVAPAPVPNVTPSVETTVDPRKAITAIANHLLLYLPLSTSLDDHSSHHLESESTGSVTVHDGAAYFPGDSFLTLPHIALENRPFAVAVWIKPEGDIVGYGIVEQVEGGPGKHLHILMRDPDKPYFGFYLNDLRSPLSIRSEMGWTHLAFIFTGTHQQIWINGMMVVERNSDPYQGVKGETRVGKAPMWNNVPSACFKGAMRDLRIYDMALSPQQIRLLAGLDAGEPQKNKKPDDTF